MGSVVRVKWLKNGRDQHQVSLYRDVRLNIFIQERETYANTRSHECTQYWYSDSLFYSFL